MPRPDGDVYVCGMADPAPLPDSPDDVVVDDAACDTFARAAACVSTALAGARIDRRGLALAELIADGAATSRPQVVSYFLSLRSSIGPEYA